MSDVLHAGTDGGSPASYLRDPGSVSRQSVCVCEGRSGADTGFYPSALVSPCQC